MKIDLFETASIIPQLFIGVITIVIIIGVTLFILGWLIKK